MCIYKKITIYINNIYLKNKIKDINDEVVNNQIYKSIINFHFYFNTYFGKDGVELYLKSLICSLIFLKRLSYIGQSFNEKNILPILLVSIMVSSKINDDIPPDNKFYIRLIDIKLHELNKIEIDFCKKMNYNFHVTYDEYKNQINSL